MAPVARFVRDLERRTSRTQYDGPSRQQEGDQEKEKGGRELTAAASDANFPWMTYGLTVELKATHRESHFRGESLRPALKIDLFARLNDNKSVPLEEHLNRLTAPPPQKCFERNICLEIRGERTRPGDGGVRISDHG